MEKRYDGSNGKYGSSASASTSSRSPDPDPIADKIRELLARGEIENELHTYTDEDDDTTVTGNHNIVAMPGSHVHITSDPDMESEIPMAKIPRWAKVAAGVVSALIGVGSVVKAIWEATK